MRRINVKVQSCGKMPQHLPFTLKANFKFSALLSAGPCGQLTKEKFSAENSSKKGILCRAKEGGHHLAGSEALWHGFEHKSLMSDI